MKRYLILQNGTVFEGTAFGADTTAATGELVFSTVVCGFNELLTSSKTYGQIVMQTFPSVGNCGVTEEEMSKKCYPSGYVVHEWCDSPSAKNAPHTLDELLKKNGIPGISGIDTRALTRIIREVGTQRAVICGEIPSELSAVFDGETKNPVYEVTKDAVTKTHTPNDGAFHRVVLYDLGYSETIVKALVSRGVEVISVPAYTSASDALKYAPEGIVIGDGPGDPAKNTAIVNEIKAFIGKLPVLGIGLGHCIYAVANGAETEKLPFGHRGGQPVLDSITGRTFITEQYHGFAISAGSVKKGIVRYTNSNDSTPEGIDYGCDGITTEFLHDDAVNIFIQLISKE